jgi:aminoglycoside phosphotransferase (APT) family kinase protein
VELTLDVGAGAAAAAEAVVAVAGEVLGAGVAVAGRPVVVPGGFGRAAFEVTLGGPSGPLPHPWDAPVIVRVGVTPEAAHREAGWHAACAAHGCPVPPVLGLHVPPGPAGPAAVVTARGPARSLVEVLGESPLAIPDLLRAMAGVHARLRSVPVAAAPPGTPGPGSDGPLAALDAALGDARAGDRFSSERAWLEGHVPPPGPPVVCHGDFQPAVVRLDAADLDKAVVVDWSSARIADPEHDLALTCLMFWSVPYLAEGLAQRKMLKTVRDMIVNGYRAAYEATPPAGPLDGTRLRWWGVYHGLTWAVRLAAAEVRGGTPADPWDPVALVHHPTAYRRDLGRRLTRLTRRG